MPKTTGFALSCFCYAMSDLPLLPFSSQLCKFFLPPTEIGRGFCFPFAQQPPSFLFHFPLPLIKTHLRAKTSCSWLSLLPSLDRGEGAKKEKDDLQTYSPSFSTLQLCIQPTHFRWEERSCDQHRTALERQRVLSDEASTALFTLVVVIQAANIWGQTVSLILCLNKDWYFGCPNLAGTGNAAVVCRTDMNSPSWKMEVATFTPIHTLPVQGTIQKFLLWGEKRNLKKQKKCWRLRGWKILKIQEMSHPGCFPAISRYTEPLSHGPEHPGDTLSTKPIVTKCTYCCTTVMVTGESWREVLVLLAGSWVGTGHCKAVQTAACPKHESGDHQKWKNCAKQ